MEEDRANKLIPRVVRQFLGQYVGLAVAIAYGKIYLIMCAIIDVRLAIEGSPILYLVRI